MRMMRFKLKYATILSDPRNKIFIYVAKSKENIFLLQL